MIILILLATASGLLTVFSPCVLPVLPIILAGSVDRSAAKIRGIIIGLLISFSLVLLSLPFLFSMIGLSIETLRLISVALLFLIGAVMFFPKLSFAVQSIFEKFLKINPGNKKNTFFGGLLTGASLGIVWTPCVGPILAAVSASALVSEISATTVLITIFYALGVGIGLYLISAGTRKLALNFVRENYQNIQKIFGIVIILTGFLILTGADRKFQAFVISVLPSSFINLQTSVQKPQSSTKINLSDVEQGCLGGKDCIPSIDNPKFEGKDSANTWLNDSDIIFGLDYKGTQRAYPQRILNWHEIVNDTVSGDPIVITFCPLCGSAVSYERKVNGKVAQFGVSGKLYNSDLIMYDRLEESFWQQVTGEAIDGPAAERNEKLKPIYTATTTWGEWKKANPNTQVLSRDTGFTRNYDQYPYGTYEQDNQLYFGIKNTDTRLPLKAVVYGIEVNGRTKAYPLDFIDKRKVISDNFTGADLKIEKVSAGVKFTNQTTGDEIIPLRTFWFAWAAFHPDTQLYNE